MHPGQFALPRPFAFLRALPRVQLDFTGSVNEIGHPFNGPEVRTSEYILEMLREAIRRIKWMVDQRQAELAAGVAPHNRLAPAFGTAMDEVSIRHRWPVCVFPSRLRGAISGIADMVVRRNHAPNICVIEIKRYEQDYAHFDHGRAQAFLSAAAFGESQQTPMRAIVTDMRRWRFMTVGANHYTLSREERIRYNPATGVPNGIETERMVNRLVTFLAEP